MRVTKTEPYQNLHLIRHITSPHGVRNWKELGFASKSLMCEGQASKSMVRERPVQIGEQAAAQSGHFLQAENLLVSLNCKIILASRLLT